uniref:Uncharacterized protein n=1 Tax=Biomphalaria glabrata TaxID=6526 RepID=A0A2C9LN07_BIOGL
MKSSFECLLTNDCILTAAIKQEFAKNNRDDLKTLGCPFNVKDLVLSNVDPKQIEEVLNSLVEELRMSIPEEDRECFNAFDMCLENAMRYGNRDDYDICKDAKSSFDCMFKNGCTLTEAQKQDFAKLNGDDLKTVGCRKYI